MTPEPTQIILGFVEGIGASTVFVLVLFIGFCVGFGLLKTRRTDHGSVVRSLDDAITHQPTAYLSGSTPRGPADQLRTPELLEAAARK